MSKREIIPFILVAVGGIGGLTNALVVMAMVEALNTRRPANNQIPISVVSWRDMKWFLANFPFPHRRLWKEYRLQFPQSRLYFWHVIALIGMFSLIFVGAALIVKASSSHGFR